jgi:predicted RNase H-like nuclease (RuvC/YqgF family)
VEDEAEGAGKARPRRIGMTEVAPTTTRPVDHRAKLRAEIARLEREVKDKERDIEFLQDQLEDLQIELQESVD